MHPYLEECSSRDDFQRRGASCFERMLFWGLLFSEEIILFQKNPLSGMIFHRRMHPVSEESSHRDASMIKMLSLKAPKASHSHKGRKHMKYIHIHPLDNVVVALEDLKKGDLVSVTAKTSAGLQSTEAPAGLQKAASVERTSEPAKSAVSSPSSTAAGRSRSSRMA